VRTLVFLLTLNLIASLLAVRILGIYAPPKPIRDRGNKAGPGYFKHATPRFDSASRKAASSRLALSLMILAGLLAIFIVATIQLIQLIFASAVS